MLFDEDLRQPHHVLRLHIEEAERADRLLQPLSPKASIFCGVSTCAKSGFVARFTPVSVDCAESTTATAG